MDHRPLLALTLALACTPTPPEEMTGTGGATSTSDEASSTGAPTTGATTQEPTTGPAPGSSDETGETDDGTSTTDASSSTGEPVMPGCGDGIPAPGELCFLRVEGMPFTDPLTAAVFVDLDGDGDLDIAGSGRLPCPISELPDLLDLAARLDPSRDGVDQFVMAVAHGDGLGGFIPGERHEATHETARGMVAADVDGDGDADVLTLADDDKLLLYVNDGDGTLALPTATTVPTSLDDMATGDMNGDGVPDLVAVGSEVVVLIGDGMGAHTQTSFAAEDAPPRSQVVLVDVDDDGDLDVIAARSNKLGSLEVLHNDGAGALTVAQQLDLPDGVADLAIVADAQDGRPVLLASGWLTDVTLNSLQITAAGTLAVPQPVQAPDRSRLLAGRFDGDDRPDAMQLGSDGLSALLGQDPWPPAATPVSDEAFQSWSRVALAADLNGDGITDIFTSAFPDVVFVSNP